MYRRQFQAGLASCSFACLAGANFWSSAFASAGTSPAPSFSADELTGPPAGPWRRLFLDGAVIETQHNIRKVFHQAKKHPANPILVADQPWEGASAISGPYVYGTILKESGRLRMWYQLLFQGNHIGYAESLDGIHWDKPLVPHIRYQDQPTNLVVSEFDVGKTGGRCHNPSVVACVANQDPQRRYALYGFDSHAGFPRVAYSADGVAWRYPDADLPRKLFDSSDVVNFGYDPYMERYYCSWKTRNRRGRAVGIAWSKDGENWVKPITAPVFAADDLDPSDTQIYGMPVFPYQGLYIGLPWIYRARYFRYGTYSVEKLHEAQADSSRRMETQIAWSWDMTHWTRPSDRDMFIPNGIEQEWDRGMIVTARAPIVMGDQLYFYYGGTDQVHDEKRARASIGLATLRQDGFCSVEPIGTDSGWLITRREPLLAPNVVINAKCESGGSISAEILDRSNRVVPGFSREECIPFIGDSANHEMRWKQDAFSSKKRPKDCKYRFHLDRANLYSYLPTHLDPNQPDLARFQNEGP
jgi:hypothetical protein